MADEVRRRVEEDELPKRHLGANLLEDSFMTQDTIFRQLHSTDTRFL